MMQACVVFSTWINSSHSSWSSPFTSDRILIGDKAASLSVDLPLSGDGNNSCLSRSSSSARSSQSEALVSCCNKYKRERENYIDSTFNFVSGYYILPTLFISIVTQILQWKIFGIIQAEIYPMV